MTDILSGVYVGYQLETPKKFKPVLNLFCYRFQLDKGGASHFSVNNGW